MDKALNDQQDNGQDEKAKQKAKQQAKTAYAKTDFVPGDEIIFEDNLENEQLGEFPSQWDLMEGYAETGEVDGRKVIAFTDDGYGQVQPLMKDQMHFLSDVFTIEFDVFVANDKSEDDSFGDHTIELTLGNPDIENHNGGIAWITFWHRSDGGASLAWDVQKPNGGDTGGDKNLSFDEETLLV